MTVTALLQRNLEKQTQMLSGIGGNIPLYVTELCSRPMFYSEVVFLFTLLVFYNHRSNT